MKKLSLIALPLTVALCLFTTGAAANSAPVFYNGQNFGGTVISGGNIEVIAPNATRVKFYLDGDYRETDATAPFQWTLNAPAGEHVLRVRSYEAKGSTTTDIPFKIGTVTTPAPTPTPTVSTPVPTEPSGSNRTVRTVDEIRNALATAKPGDVINVADGEYTFRPRLIASANGTVGAPITLRGSRDVIIRSKSNSGDYGLSITGDYWRIEGLTVAHATKGIVLDSSNGAVLDGVEVYNIGAEAIHFRACSSNGILRNSYIHDTGQNSPQYGEGVYVGSANSNWGSYNCIDGRDNSENVLIENNTFRNIAAEGADLKEGTDSGILRNNIFDNTGFSGANSADSAVDAKGNGWLIQGNIVRNSSGSFLDGFQTHNVYSGYGVNNTFRTNTVEGAIPGWGIGSYPTGKNTVTCDNQAVSAAKGLTNNACS